MAHFLTRRKVMTTLVATAVMPSFGSAQTSDIWSVGQVFEALKTDQIRLIDVRSRAEWDETGLAEGA